MDFSGKELEEYKERKERASRLEQEAMQRHKQMQELQNFHSLQDEKEDKDDDAEDDEQSEQPTTSPSPAAKPMIRQSSAMNEAAEANAERKRRRLEGLMKYRNPQHDMFTTVEAKYEYDDFGVKINADDYKDITSTSLLPRHRYGLSRPGQSTDAEGAHTNGQDADENRQFLPEASLHRMYSAAEPEEIPSKIEVHEQSVQV